MRKPRYFTPEQLEKRRETSRKWAAEHRDLMKKRSKDWAAANPDVTLEYGRAWKKKKWKADPEFREKKVEMERQRRAKRRYETIMHYGGKCYCCGESEIKFLSLDHINGGGTKHRKDLGNMRIEQWARINNFPTTLRVACHNCNMGAHLNDGVCPHKKGKG